MAQLKSAEGPEPASSARPVPVPPKRSALRSDTTAELSTGEAPSPASNEAAASKAQAPHEFRQAATPQPAPAQATAPDEPAPRILQPSSPLRPSKRYASPQHAAPHPQHAAPHPQHAAPHAPSPKPLPKVLSFLIAAFGLVAALSAFYTLVLVVVFTTSWGYLASYALAALALVSGVPFLEWLERTLDRRRARIIAQGRTPHLSAFTLYLAAHLLSIPLMLVMGSVFLGYTGADYEMLFDMAMAHIQGQPIPQWDHYGAYPNNHLLLMLMVAGFSLLHGLFPSADQAFYMMAHVVANIAIVQVGIALVAFMVRRVWTPRRGAFAGILLVGYLPLLLNCMNPYSDTTAFFFIAAALYVFSRWLTVPDFTGLGKGRPTRSTGIVPGNATNPAGGGRGTGIGPGDSADPEGAGRLANARASAAESADVEGAVHQAVHAHLTLQAGSVSPGSTGSGPATAQAAVAPTPASLAPTANHANPVPSRNVAWVGLLVLFAVIGVVGFKFKATVAVVLVAGMLVILLSRRLPQALAACAVVALASVLALGATNAAVNVLRPADMPYDDAVKDQLAFPYEHWLMMALNPDGTGAYVHKDFLYTVGYPTYAEKRAADQAMLLKRIDQLGPAGLLERVAVTKPTTLWASGALLRDYELADWAQKGPLASGAFSLAMDYAQAYQMLLLGAIGTAALGLGLGWRSVAAALAQARAQRRSREALQAGLVLVTLLTVFGACLFICVIWEAKPRYLLQFAPCFAVLFVQGAVVAMRWWRRLRTRRGRPAVSSGKSTEL